MAMFVRKMLMNCAIFGVHPLRQLSTTSLLLTDVGHLVHKMGWFNYFGPPKKYPPRASKFDPYIFFVTGHSNVNHATC